MNEATWVTVVNFGAFGAFCVLLLVGATSTLSRVAYYRMNGYRRPRLLGRDAILVGGFSLSFGLLLGASIARALGYDTSTLASDIRWILITRIPAIVAVATYAYFELFVIERDRLTAEDDS